MPTSHDAVAALPTGAAAEKALLRNLVTKRMAYVLADADTVTDLVAVDPATGAAILDILYLGRVFHYDATDTTTPHDGVTCLVTSEGRRYKLAAGTDVVAYSVLDKDLATPPGSPMLGDAYLVAAGATGAWAGHSDEVAVYTIRGWEFIDFGIGRLVYVEDVDSYYHKDSNGNWLAGFGTQALSANSVPLSATINFGRVFQVENQTTNTPPGSPVVPTAYIIGGSPTGSWSGHTLKIAICESDGSFTIYAARVGDIAYDKALSIYYRWTGSAWEALFGAWRQVERVSTASGSTSVVGSTFYAVSAVTAPKTTDRKTEDSSTLTITAGSGALLKFTYSAAIVAVGGVPSGQIAVALFRDSEANAIDWKYFQLDVTGYADIHATFLSTADGSSHTYKMAIMSLSGPIDVNIVRRHFIVEATA